MDHFPYDDGLIVDGDDVLVAPDAAIDAEARMEDLRENPPASRWRFELRRYAAMDAAREREAAKPRPSISASEIVRERLRKQARREELWARMKARLPLFIVCLLLGVAAAMLVLR